MALAQLNLKLPAEVLEEWRRRAAEAGHGSSVRDWLLSVLSPTAEEAPGLADRVAALEEAVAELQQQQARPAAPRRVPLTSPPRALPGADRPVLATGEGIETAALAERLGIRGKTLAEQVRKAGGGQPGLELYGWRCLGTFPSSRGGHPRALWVPAGTASSTSSEEATATGPVPAAGAAGLPGYLPGLEPVPPEPGLGTHG